MGDTYRKGSHYITCDRTGLKIRVEDARREYTGSYVSKDWYESRHPLDLARSRAGGHEGGPVRPSRPDPLWQFNGALTTKLSVAALPGNFTLNVETSARFFAGDAIGVILESGEQFRTLVHSVGTGTLGIRDPLPRGAELGALITDYSAISEPDLG